MAILGDKAVGDIVKIKENGTAYEYIIVQKGLPSDIYDNSCDGIWVMRKKAHSNRVWTWEPANNNYEASSIHKWLNETFINRFDNNIREAIKKVKIPYIKGTVSNSATPAQTGENGLLCQLFLLSIRETGYTPSNDSKYTDGTKLSYFLSGNNDDASFVEQHKCQATDGYDIEWWLRTGSEQDYYYAHIYSQGKLAVSDVTFDTPCVRPVFVLPPDISVSSDGILTINALPTITSDKTGDLGTLTEGFTCNYSVNDVDIDDILTVSLYIDDSQIDSFEAVREKQYTYTLTGTDWLKITNGTHIFKIVASDDKGTVESMATFTRECARLTTTLRQPLPADDPIMVCTLKVTGSISPDAMCLYEVTNNANDPEPVWEDCTVKSKAGSRYAFTNKTAVNGFAFNYRVTIERGASGTGGYISQISGGFE